MTNYQMKVSLAVNRYIHGDASQTLAKVASDFKVSVKDVEKAAVVYLNSVEA